MYKDPDKQREANAERQRRYKARQKGVTSEGVTAKALLEGKEGVTDAERDKAIEFMAAEAGKAERAEPERTAQGNIRVSQARRP